MIEQLFLLSLAVPIGLLSGLAIGIPGSVAILLSYPLLFELNFNFILAFYLIVAITTQFTNSVMAIYAGIPGDITAIPIVNEREKLFKNFSVEENLHRTAIASIFGVIFGIAFLFFAFNAFSKYSNYLLRSEVLFFLLISIIVISLFWKPNTVKINLPLIGFGLLIGTIGYHPNIQYSIMTFDKPLLMGGFPFIAGFIGMYAAPNIFQISKMYENTIHSQLFSSNYFYKNKNKNNFYIFDYFLGSIIGLVGLIPLIGSSMSSNLAYSISRKLTKCSLRRAVASESSNSSSHIIVLGPLLFFGIAIVPSEMILLNVLSSSGWNLNHITEKTFFILLVTATTILPVCYIASTYFAKIIVQCIIYNAKIIAPIIFVFLICNVFYIGSLTSEIEIYLITFVFSLVLGILFKKMNIQCLPLIFSWAISDTLINIGNKISILYFY